MRNKVIHLLRFIQTRILPSELYSKVIFYKLMGYRLNLKNPRSLNEKLQWMKLRGPKFIDSSFVDKIAVRDYISSKVGAEYLVPLIGTWENVDDFNLPQEKLLPYIVKPNHDSGVGYIFRNGNEFSIDEVKSGLNKRLRINHYHRTKEYPYKKVVPRILCETLLCDAEGRIPDDIKFHCFGGNLEFIYVSVDREGIDSRHIYSRNWTRLSFSWNKDPSKFCRGDDDIPKPEMLNKMISIAESLAAGFPYVRVDLYNLDTKIYVGELTFFQGSGFDPIRPVKKDFELGKKLNLALLESK